MILTIHDNNLQKVAFIDNNKQETLNFYNDKWTRYLSKASSLFEFTVFKQTIQTDVIPYQTANALNDQSFVSFVYKGRTYLFNVMTIEETEHTITCTCKDLNLELTNEYTNPFKSDQPRTFEEYCNVMGLLDFAALRIGVNEISDQRRTLEWTGQDTKLNRILSLANKFDAEVDFEVKLNANGTIKDFILNVYREHDDKHQGVGKVRSDIILKKGKNIRSIKRKIDKTDLIVNAVRPTAQGENGQEITIAGLGPWEVKNENGVVEFFQQGEMLYAPISMQKYPSAWTDSTGNRDKYTRKDITVDTKSKEMLRTQAYKELMRSAYPSVTYEIDGYVDLEIGDTAKVYNGDFYPDPALLLEVRVSEQTISFTKPSTNKTVFDNVRALKNKLSSGIQERWQELFEASKPYLIKLATDNGVIFKNQIGQSIITPSLYKGGKPVTTGVTWRWSLDGTVKTGMTYTVRGADVTNTSTLTVAAYIGNDEVAVDELSFVNVLDGTMGTPGKPGQDGRTPYIHTAWANNETGTSGFSLDNSINKLYIGIYTDFEPADSQDPKKYKWTKIKGDKGDKGDTGARGIQGIQGVRGEQGIPGEKGADGKTQYTHIAYANSADGRTDFSTSASNRSYIGMYVDFNSQDSTNPSDYAWTLVKGADGAQGIPGPKGADGRTPYIHFAYSDNADGTGLTTSDNGQRYIGHYSDYTQADSTDKTKYRWADRWARLKLEDNLLLNSSFNQNLTQWQGTGVTIVGGKARITGEFNKTKDIYQSIKSQTANDDVSQVYIASISVKVSNYAAGSINPYLALYISGIKNDSAKTWFGATYLTPSRLEAVNNKGIVQFTTTFKVNVPRSQIDRIEFHIYARDFTGEVEFEKVSLRRGNIDLGWQASPEDLQNQLDTKADQVLTQEQLNALNERAQILDAELKAKASMDALSDLEKAYQSFVKSNADSRAKAEADLAEAGRRIELLVTQFGGFKELKTFIDTYMSSSNEGLIIGKNDASSTIKVSSDRISMFSAGKEVMYISQGVIHIDNGIFTASVQIGKFRTEQYHLNADMNVIRYVG
ncbi:TPA: phage tail protein [Streptococcus suis]|nr:phage tail protein [Streptococcus suis]HEL2634160.1 phage tail protein [Streptococcus suis]